MYYLQVKNETWALWTWYRNQDSNSKVGDQIYIVRQPDLCPTHQKKVFSDGLITQTFDEILKATMR